MIDKKEINTINQKINKLWEIIKEVRYQNDDIKFEELKRLIPAANEIWTQKELISDDTRTDTALIFNEIAFHYFAPNNIWEQAREYYNRACELTMQPKNSIEEANMRLNLRITEFRCGIAIDDKEILAIKKILINDRRQIKADTLLSELKADKHYHLHNEIQNVDINKKVTADDLPKQIQWKEQAIFISSTFKDMQAERDILHDRVFPRLRKRLIPYFINIVPIDLRNGIETVGNDSDVGKELQVLDVCLNEIKRCKPFLLVLLGERYGWVPDTQRMQKTIETKKNTEEFKDLHTIDISDTSVTHLEIEFGTLSSSDQRKRTHYFFRTLHNAKAIPAHLAPMYDDRYSTDEMTRLRHKKLIALKEKIKKNEVPEKVHEYECKYDEQNNTIVQLEEWANNVEELLFEQITLEQAEFIQSIANDPFYNTWQEEEKRVVNEFFLVRSQRFVGRKEEINQIMQWCKDPNMPQGLLLTGEAGLGKSSLCARFLLELNSKNQKPFILYHAVGVSSRAGSPDSILSRWIYELARGLGLSNTDPAQSVNDIEAKKNLFSQLLGKMAQKSTHGVMCVIDSLDSLEQSELSRTMNWLPHTFPQNTKLLVTAIPCDASKALAHRTWIAMQKVQPFASRENLEPAYNLIHKVCELHHKQDLDPAVAQALCKVELPTGELACSNPLWLNISVNRMIMLDATDFEKIDKRTEEQNDVKIQAYRVELASSLPSKVEDMYDNLFAWCAERFGRRNNISWIPAMLDYIACSRFGLRESDLEELLVVQGRNRTDATVKEELRGFSLSFALVRDYLYGHIVQRGELGLWDFVHTQGRKSRLDGHYGDAEALQGKGENLNNPEHKKHIHQKIARWLLQLTNEDGLRIQETMWHLYKGDMKKEAGKYYGRNPSEFVGVRYDSARRIIIGGELDLVTSVLVEVIAQDERESYIGNRKKIDPTYNEAITWYIDVMDLAEDSCKHELADHVIFYILPSLGYKSRLPTQSYLAERSQGIYEELWNNTPQKMQAARHVSLGLRALSNIQLQLGNPDEALSYGRRSLSISEALSQINPKDYLMIRDVSKSHLIIGRIHFLMENIEEALAYFTHSLKIIEELWKNTPEDYLMTLDVSECLYWLGNTHFLMKNHEKAFAYFTRSLAISEELSKSPHPQDDQITLLVIVILNDLGMLQLEMGNFEEALFNFTLSLSSIKELLHKNPNNIEATERELFLLNNIGSIYLYYYRQPKNAIGYYERSLAICRNLLDKTPESAQIYNSFIICATNLFAAYTKCWKFIRAIKLSNEKSSVFQEMEKRGIKLSAKTSTADQFKKMYNI